MPQMSPLSWLFLYIYLLLVIYLFNMILNYFMINFKEKNKLSKLNFNNYKWYW